jgi:hypothetical protein
MNFERRKVTARKNLLTATQSGVTEEALKQASLCIFLPKSTPDIPDSAFANLFPKKTANN